MNNSSTVATAEKVEPQYNKELQRHGANLTKDDLHVYYGGKFKEELKRIAADIKTGNKAWYLPHEYRHLHIAYCLMRGKSMKEIEPRVRLHHQPNMYKIKSILAQFEPAYKHLNLWEACWEDLLARMEDKGVIVKPGDKPKAVPKEPAKNKLYVIVRTDLKKSSPAVQAGHAVAEFLQKHDTPWGNGTMVYLKAGSPFDLVSFQMICASAGLDHSEFKEPDIGNEVTAIACVTSKPCFKDFSLLE